MKALALSALESPAFCCVSPRRICNPAQQELRISESASPQGLTRVTVKKEFFFRITNPDTQLRGIANPTRRVVLRPAGKTVPLRGGTVFLPSGQRKHQPSRHLKAPFPLKNPHLKRFSTLLKIYSTRDRPFSGTFANGKLISLKPKTNSMKRICKYNFRIANSGKKLHWT